MLTCAYGGLELRFLFLVSNLQEYAMCDLAGALSIYSLGYPGWICSGGVPISPICGDSGNIWTGITCDDTGAITKIEIYGFGVTGYLPSSIGLLSDLVMLAATGNFLYGTIPTEIGLLSQIVYLDLGVNMFSGSIPSSIGRLSNLKTFGLYYNYLTGRIPSSIGSLSQLELFLVFWNSLSGKFADALPITTITQYSFSFSYRLYTTSHLLPHESDRIRLLS